MWTVSTTNTADRSEYTNKQIDRQIDTTLHKLIVRMSAIDKQIVGLGYFKNDRRRRLDI